MPSYTTTLYNDTARSARILTERANDLYTRSAFLTARDGHLNAEASALNDADKKYHIGMQKKMARLALKAHP